MDQPQDDKLLRLIERVAEHAPKDNVRLGNAIAALREELRNRDNKDQEQEELLAKYEDAYQKLTSPANKVGIFLRFLDDGNVVVAFGDTEYVAQVDPKMNLDDLRPGARIRLNEAYAVVGLMPESPTGPLIKVSDVLADGRLRVGTDQTGGQGRLIERSKGLESTTIKPGDEVRTDGSGRVAVEHFEKQDTKDYFVEEVPQTPWSQVGGQEEAIKLIRDTIEHPLLYPELYARFDKKPVKGILLYGPPGCGKTLIGKATAYNLAKEYSARKGV
ncbi:MAG: AAA family ATPase, partial [bacterium]